MSTQSLYFIRHGQKQSSSSYNSIKNKTLPLTNRGKAQANRVGKFLKSNTDVSAIYSSDYTRAVSTAEISNRHLKLPIQIDEHLGERVLFVSDVISSLASKREFIKSHQDWNYSTGGGESLMTALERFKGSISDILEDNTGNIAIFTHGRILQTYLEYSFPGSYVSQTELTINSGDVYRVDYDNGIPIDWQLVFSPVSIDKGYTTIETLADTLVLRDTLSKKVLKTHVSAPFLSHNILANIYEDNSLSVIRDSGLRVPGGRKLIRGGRYLSMNYINGSTFGDIISSDYRKARNLSERLGKVLRILHDRVNNESYHTTFDISSANPMLNAQCALNFVTTMSIVERSTYSDRIGKLFEKDVDIARRVIRKHPYYLESEDIIYGDFKPDNVIIGHHLYMIDPHLSYGRVSCDLGKMISRFYLINPNTAADNTRRLLNGYRPSPDILKEIRHMAAFDILNTYSRLKAKDQLSKNGIQSHNNAIDNMEYCLEAVIPGLLGTDDILVIRHLDDLQDFRVHYRNTPILEGEREKIPDITRDIVSTFSERYKTKIVFITSPQIRTIQTVRLIMSDIRKQLPETNMVIHRDKRIMDLYHGGYVISDDYRVGEKPLSFTAANKAYVEQSFKYRNIDYRYGDSLGGKYEYIKDMFSEYGENQRHFSIRFYDFVRGMLETMTDSQNTLFIIVTHTAIAFRLFELSNLINNLAVSRSNIETGDLIFNEWNQVYSLDKEPGNQLFISPGQVKQLNLDNMVGYSWRFQEEVEYLSDRTQG